MVGTSEIGWICVLAAFPFAQGGLFTYNGMTFEKILLPRQDDYLDGYRAEYNAMLMDKVTDSSNSVMQERYITLSVHRKSIEEARTFFDRVTADVTTRLNHLDSHSEELDAVERLRVLFLKDYASYIKDSMVNELTALNRTMMASG